MSGRANGNSYSTPDSVVFALEHRYSTDGVVWPQMRISQSLRSAAVRHFGTWAAAVQVSGLVARRPREYETRVCKVERCRRPFHSRGYCSRHYQRLRQYGTLERTTNQAYSLSERFWNNLIVEDVLQDGCWPWRGDTLKGYGILSSGTGGVKRSIRAHRLSYALMAGVIPDGLTIDHMCHDSSVCAGGVDCPHRRCVNPAHLELATVADNARRSLKGVPRGPRPRAALTATLTEGNRGRSNA